MTSTGTAYTITGTGSGQRAARDAVPNRAHGPHRALSAAVLPSIDRDAAAIHPSMSRDWETHVYFEHRPLTPVLLAAVLAGLGASGISPDRAGAARYPALASLDGGTAAELEDLLRSREPPVGPGYGVLPCRVRRPALPEAEAFLTFSRPDPITGLDGVILAVDGGCFGDDTGTALDAASDWLFALCRALDATYGWADWETASFLVAAPSRRDVRAGRLPRRMRLNALGPALAHLAPDEVTGRWEDGVVVFERGDAASSAGPSP